MFGFFMLRAAPDLFVVIKNIFFNDPLNDAVPLWYHPVFSNDYCNAVYDTTDTYRFIPRCSLCTYTGRKVLYQRYYISSSFMSTMCLYKWRLLFACRKASARRYLLILLLMALPYGKKRRKIANTSKQFFRHKIMEQ